MSRPSDLQGLTLSGIAHRCKAETERFFRRQQYDPHYCFELFRRAIADHNEHAWELIYAQYSPQVAGWVKRHSAYASTGEEAQYLINRAFEKMWMAMTPEKLVHFPNLKSLLRYLQMCVHSTIIDTVRASEQATLEIEEERLDVQGGSSALSVERVVMDQVQRQQLWQEIGARLRTDQERKVVYGSFVLALKPRELYAQYRKSFRDVNEVYRVKENVLARLRRDADLRELFGHNA